MASNKTISIGFKVEDGGDGFKKISMDASELKRIMQGNITEAEKFTKKLKDIGQVNWGIDAIKEMGSVMTELSKAFAVQVEAETKLATVMRQRMSATEQDIQSIKDYCSAQQEIGIIGDEVQLAGVQQMATFLNQRDALETLIPAMNNLVAQQRGFEASAGDCVSIANLLGKAMIGDVMALKEVGITFSEAEKKAVQFGTEQERAAALAQIITNNVGNMNAELAKTDAGRAKQVENAMGDLNEQIGSVVAGLQPLIEKFNFFVLAGANVGKAVNALRLIPTALSTVKSGIIAANTAIDTFIAKQTAAAGASTKMAATVKWSMRIIKGAMATTLVGAGVWALGEAIGWLVNKFSDAGEGAKELGGDFEDMANSASETKQKLSQMTSDFQKHVEIAKNFKGTKEEEKKLVEELNAAYGDTMGRYSSIAEWQKVLIANTETYIEYLSLQARAEKLLNSLVLGRTLQRNLEKLDTPITGDSEFAKSLRAANEKKKEELISTIKKQADKDQTEYDSITQELAKHRKTLKITTDPTGDTGKGGATARKEPPPPKDSIKWMEEEISKLDAKFKITLDKTEQAKILEQIGILKDKIEETKATIYLEMRGGAEWTSFADKVEKQFQSKPITIAGKLKVDKEDLTAPIKKITPAVSKELEDTTEKNEAFNKTLSEGATFATNLGSAFSQIANNSEDPQSKVAGIVAATIANIMGSFASALAQSSPLGPFGWAAFGVAGLAQALAMVQQVKSVTAFANGGIVSGPTMALVGEYAGASNNPEVIAPLNKLRDLLPEPGAGVQHVVVEGRIKGSDIELVTGNRRRVASVSGRKY